MKKVIAFVLCLAMLVGMTTFAAQASTTMYIKTTNGANVNVRSDPWKTADNIITSIPYGWTVEVTDFNAKDTWTHIRTSWKSAAIDGWVSTGFLVSKDPGTYKGGSSTTGDVTTLDSLNKVAKAITVLEEPYLTVIQTKKATNFVHLRWFPDTNAVYSGAYLCNTEIEVLAASKDWAQVRIVEDGKVGFIVMSCVAPVEQ